MDALSDVRVVAVTAQIAVMDFSPPFTVGSGENASSSVAHNYPMINQLPEESEFYFFSWSRKFKCYHYFHAPSVSPLFQEGPVPVFSFPR